MLKFKTINLTNQLIQILAVTVGLIVINLLASQLTYRIDLTQNQLFSISPATEETLQNLDDIVTVKFYQSANIPSRFQPVVSDVTDMLAAYDRVGGNKFKLKHIIIDDDPTLENKAQSYGLRPLQFNTIEDDQFQVATGYLGLVMIYGDRTELIPALTNISNLEYELTSRLLKLTSSDSATVGFTSGHGEWELAGQNGIGLFASGLRQQYTVTSVNLDDKTTADLTKKADILIVSGPKQPFSSVALYSLDQFLLAGKPIIFLTDGVSVDQNLKAQSADHNLYDFLTHFGVTLNQDLVVDKSFQPAFFQSPQGSFQAPYPFWVRIGPVGFNSEFPPVSSLNDVITPWVSSISPIDESVKVLFSSSSQSYTQLSDQYNLDPLQEWKFDTQSLQSYPLAVTRTGPAKSFFTSETAAQTTGADQTSWRPDTNQSFISVIGDSDLIRDLFIRDMGKTQNAVLVANLVDSMLSGDKLISIRSKIVSSSALGPVDGPTKTQTKLAVILLPLIVVGLAAVWQLFILPGRRS